jgi:hypothetical protein
MNFKLRGLKKIDKKLKKLYKRNKKDQKVKPIIEESFRSFSECSSKNGTQKDDLFSKSF